MVTLCGSRDDLLCTKNVVCADGILLVSLGAGIFHIRDSSLVVSAAFLNIPSSVGNGISIIPDFSAVINRFLVSPSSDNMTLHVVLTLTLKQRKIASLLLSSADHSSERNCFLSRTRRKTLS